MLVNCRSCRTPLQVPKRAKWIRCFLCQAITRTCGLRHKGSINEAKQGQLEVILNKLRSQNFVKQVKEVNIDSAVTLRWFVSQLYDKALMEPRFCEMFANICSNLDAVLPDFSEDNKMITFKKLLLNKCQEEFEREANRVEEEGDIKCSEEEREEKKRRLGNIKLIGELYKKKMLAEIIMHECIKKLLGQNQTPDEEDIESLCELMSTIGVMIDHPEAKKHMDTYFDTMTKFSNNMELSSRVRFMLKDSIDLRNNKWQHRRKIKGWKKIDHGNRDLRASDRSLDRSMPSSSAPVQATSVAHSSTASATVSTHRLSTSTSSSASVTGNQEDVSNHAGGVKSSPRMSRDVTRSSDSMQSPPSDMVELTPSNLSSQDLTHISSLKNGNSVEGLSSVGGSLVSSEEALPDASVSVDSIHHQGIVNSCSILLSEAQAQAQTQAPTVEAENDIITAKEDGQIKGVPDDWEDAAELSKEADAAGSTSDLYMAYKGPEEKQENVVPGESIESSCSILLREAQAQTPTRKLNTFVGKQGRPGSAGNNEDGNISKKYSRDFLLTLSEQCTDLPTGFEIESDIAESLMSVQVAISHLVNNKWWALSDRSPTLTTKPSTHVRQMLTYARVWF